MTDNRTNEPNQNETKSDQTFCFTEDAVERAALAVAEVMHPRWLRSAQVNAAKDRGSLIHYAGRAALVAAQGAAPQAAKDIHEPSHDRVYCVRCGGNWPCQAPQAENGSRSRVIDLAEKWADEKLGGYIARTSFMQGVRFALDVTAAPALPSSTVDEIAEVIERARWRAIGGGTNPTVEAATSEHIARAVVEAIGGEGL